MDMRNIQEFCWPTIKDGESAKKAAEQGFYAALLYLFLALTPILSGQAEKILDVVVVALCGYFSKRLWRTAAVIGLAMIAPELVLSLAGGVSFRLASAAILTLMFVNAVRGTFLYHRYASGKPSAPTVEVLPPEPPPQDKENPPQA